MSKITDAPHSYRNLDNRWTPEDFARWTTSQTLEARDAEV